MSVTMTEHPTGKGTVHSHDNQIQIRQVIIAFPEHVRLMYDIRIAYSTKHIRSDEQSSIVDDAGRENAAIINNRKTLIQKITLNPTTITRKKEQNQKLLQTFPNFDPT